MKNNDLILLDLFSGIGGFHKGLLDAGFQFKDVYYSEIDKHAIANYKYNYPNAKYIGSVETISKSGISRPNIITFGSPCQDFSLAGKRAGLGGSKSSLISYAISGVDYFRPEVFIWENVKGTFSSNRGRDFLAILQAIAYIGGYECEWQLVNTSWLLPQNRERIYLVGHLATAFGDWRNIFPIGENEEMVNKAQRKTGPANKIASTITSAGESKLNLSANYILSKGDNYVENPVKDNTTIISHYGHINEEPSISNIVPTLRAENHGHIPCVAASRGRSASCLSPRRTEYGKSIRKEYEKGNIKEKRKYIQQLEPRKDGLTNTLTSVQKDNLLQDNQSIRRLTEIECERLQGFPDNWTKYGSYDGVTKAIPKTQRYKMLGNAVTSKMVQFIGNRILINYS